MKSNHERSNECLPPKKREIPATSRSTEEKIVGPTNDNHRAESSTWRPGTPSIQGGMAGRQHGTVVTSPEVGLQQGIGLQKSSSTGVDYSSPCAPRSVLATADYPSTLSHAGIPVTAMQYAQLQQAYHFVSPQYSAQYAGLIPPQLISPTSSCATGTVASTASVASTPSHRSHLEAYSTLLANMSTQSSLGHKVEQHLVRTSGLISSSTPPPSQSNQYIHISNSPHSASRTLSPPSVPVHLHPHAPGIPHAVTLCPPSQVVVQYADSGGHFVTRDNAKKTENFRLQAAQAKEILNGELEKNRRYGASPSMDHHLKSINNKSTSQHYETRHVVVHPNRTEYSVRDSSGGRTSMMVAPNSNTPTTEMDVHQTTNRGVSPSAVRSKGNVHLGKSVHRSYALSPQQTLGHEGVKAVATLSPHTVIQTTHSAAEQLSVGLPATAFYAGTQQPVIGYFSSHQHMSAYPGGLPPHLVIPGTQPLLIPVGNADMESSAPTIVTSSPQFAAVPHTFVTTAIPKRENFSAESLPAQPAYQAAVVQAQIHLPVVHSVASPTAASPTLPPYFMKGSIIQLANGDLKKVEDLKTEDFILSAEISNELKIDSSTVERIDDSNTPGIAVIQFAVGEHRAQVSVEVVVEYPFFVFGQGWSSCCPDRTSQLFELPCSKLSVGDVCISLTLKNLKNGAIKKSQAADPTSIFLKHPKNDSVSGSRPRYAEQENGIDQARAHILSENGELKYPDKTGLPAAALLSKADSSKPKAIRKRRWSAPETRKLEKLEEEPPLTLPKPSFIPQEVKICIEGRSNVGK
ncbi:ataxin-1 [Ambystoma mexicanum]|uniref:ataxin-1 n=1 Tax=Ambystoma mexicanum TaxID=8296 RepID=UPI0037E855BC